VLVISCFETQGARKGAKTRRSWQGNGGQGNERGWAFVKVSFRLHVLLLRGRFAAFFVAA
jgi:hypothetical protein